MRNKRKTIKFNANDHIIVNLKEEGKKWKEKLEV